MSGKLRSYQSVRFKKGLIHIHALIPYSVLEQTVTKHCHFVSGLTKQPLHQFFYTLSITLREQDVFILNLILRYAPAAFQNSGMGLRHQKRMQLNVLHAGVVGMQAVL